MNEMEQTTFTVIDDNGKEITCDVLFTFESDETGKNYIVYTDNSLDDKGNTQVFASIYDPSQSSPKLEPIETEKEWQIIQKILDTLQEEIKNRMEQAATEESGTNEQ